MAEVYDGEWQLLSHDQATGVSKWIMPDPDGPTYEGFPTRWLTRTTTPTANVEAMVERNKRLYNDSEGKKWGEGQVAYSIPLDEFFRSGFAEASMNQDRTWCKRFLNDPDNRAFRTFKGNL